nr:hypothetical protein [Bacteroidota bacterium]
MRASSKALITLVMAATTILFAAKFVSSETGISAITENQFIRDLKSRVDKFMDFIPQDRVYLQFDKTLYQPGETIWFSAYVRDAIDMQPSLKSDMVHVELINPKGTVEKEIILVAKNGKAAGDFQLTAEQLGGIYKVKAYTKWQLNEPDSLYFQKDITVQEVILPTLKMKLDFERKAYGKGDDVTAKLEIATNENQPLSNHAFKYVVNIDGEKLLEKNSETGNDGVMYVRFALPKNLKSNDGILNVMIEHEGKTESISRSIPIVLNNIQLTFYPEGGDMVANADGHIAFKAVNEFGKPADIEGEVKDSKHNVVATFASYYNGMGDFAFTPKPNETYTASVTKPANIETEFQLPVTLATGYNLHVENNYDGRLTVSIYAPAAGEVSLTGNIRGKVVYASSVQCAEGVNNVVISTNSFPMGVAQFTLFDKGGSEMCERLTFVNYHKQLQLSITADKEKYLPREKVKLTVLVKDENGSPVAASLSMSVTNDQLLAMADDKQGNMISEMLLQPDVRGKIEEPAFYFSENAKAKKALDYLLMTNGWRRFEWKKILQDPLPIISYQPEQAIITGYVYDISKGTPMPQVTIKAGNKQYQTNGVGYYSIKGIDISKEQEIEFAMQGFDLQKQKIEFYGQHDIQMRPKGYNPPRAVVVEAMMEEDRFQNAPMQNLQAVEIAAAPRPARRKMVELEKFKMVAAKNEDLKDKPIAQNKPKREEMKKQRMGFFAADAPMGKAKRNAEDNAGQRDDEAPVAQAAPVYYRSREFAMPDYSTSKASAARTDFRSTIFWNGQIDIDASGKKVFEFYTSDEVTSFRVMVEGIGSNGLIGHSEKTIFTQLPFSISVKFPIELVSEDAVSIPVTLKNNSTKLLSVSINVNAPEVLTAYTPIVSKVDIEPMQAKVIYYNYKTGYGNGEYDIAISATANGMSDAMEQKIKVSPKGFPVQQSFSSNQMHDKFTASLNDVVLGSVDVTLTAYPNIVSDLLKGVDAILREPYGCFEQTSMSSYPNVLVMDYLKTSGQEDPKIMAQAEKLIDKGYKMLTKYEASQRGYEWFGSNPGHEALTAYGLMQFNDMKSVYPNLDEKMIKRTADWLTARKDGKGGFCAIVRHSIAMAVQV